VDGATVVASHLAQISFVRFRPLRATEIQTRETGSESQLPKDTAFEIWYNEIKSGGVTRLAIYRLEAKIIGREKRGRSVVAAAAYRAGTKLRDELRDKIYDYGRRLKGVLSSKILAPAGAPDWVLEPERLWNTVEHNEKRKDAQLAREFVLAVPRELDADTQFQTAVDWARKEFVASGLVAEVSLHHDKEGRNPHVHILCTMRKLDGDKFSAKKAREFNDVGLLVHQRESWANAVNAALEKAGRTERVDHRSLEARGIDRAPQEKIGVAATAMKRRGFLLDPERFKLVRFTKIMNEVRPLLKSIRKFGEVQQIGMGKTWWEKSVTFMSRIREKSRSKWRKYISAQRSKSNEPDLER
jgi:ATP-dependent exoDNAse (exonuclease V) alpha subunit